MYFVLYDRYLKSIGEPYILESWNRTQRSNDFDNMSIVGAEIPTSANPFFVVINDKKGSQLFSGLASTPIINDKTKKTTITLKDYLTLFNSDIIADWSKLTNLYTNVGSLLSLVFSWWKNQILVGFENINIDTLGVSSILIDSTVHNSSLGKENVSASKLIFDIMNYYGVYCEPILDLKTKTLTFYFKKTKTNQVEIKLKDFGINAIEKSFGDYNRATVYNSSFSIMERWALTENNTVANITFETPENIIYPAKNKNFIASDNTQTAINDARYDAVIGLAQNRYQENIDLDAQKFKSIIDLTNTDFSYDVSVYADNGYYKSLPVGEIETDSKGKHIVKLGYRVQELTQEL